MAARARAGQAAYVTCPLCYVSMSRHAFRRHASTRHEIKAWREAKRLLAEHDGKLFNLEVLPISKPFSNPRGKPSVDPGKYGDSVLPARSVQAGAPGSGKRR